MLTVVHLFAGSGGCTLGFQRAGFRSLGSFDFDAKACRDLERLTGGPAFCRDLTALQPGELRDLTGACPDAVVMSPPCKSFSGCMPAARAGEGPEGKRPQRVKELADVVETCDAAACSSCAREHGWRRRGHICCSPRSKSTTIDHCHVHAQADSLGSSDWIGGPAVDLARREVRAACARASITTCPKEQNS